MSVRRISAKGRLQWSTVGYMTGFWVVVGILQALYKSVNYDTTTQEVLFGAPKGYSLISFLLINLIGPLTAGIIAAPLIVFVFKERLKTKSYLVSIGLLGMVFFIYVLVLNTTVSWIFYFNERPWGTELSLQDFLGYFLLDPYAMRNIISWMLVGFVTVLMLQISDKYGPGVFNKMILGKYHHPKEEVRIFMFLDLNDSTGIAEKLGNIQFFKLLNSFFADVTDGILDSRGEIYQYVGDEVVISWTAENGLSRANCLRCFFKIERMLQNRAAYYQSTYGMVPKFKAGIHMGPVIVGEIGIIKKDIVYSGDVLNTTSRILDQCNVYGQKLIVSQEVYDKLGTEHRGFNFLDLGPVSLKGKDTNINLHAVQASG